MNMTVQTFLFSMQVDVRPVLWRRIYGNLKHRFASTKSCWTERIVEYMGMLNLNFYKKNTLIH